MIIFDLETTGLVVPGLVNIEEQPQIIEFAGIILDDATLEETERMEFLVNPGIQLPEEIIKITHITDDMLADKEPFAAHYLDLANFFLGESMLVAHNLDFDKTVLRYELTRIDKQFAFPWPFHQVCTVQASFGIMNKMLRLGVLHEYVMGKGFADAHRAMADTEALVNCVRWMRERGML